MFFISTDETALNHLKERGAFSIEGEIQGLVRDDELLAFFDFAVAILKSKKNYDLINGYMGLFIKVI